MRALELVSRMEASAHLPKNSASRYNTPRVPAITRMEASAHLPKNTASRSTSSCSPPLVKGSDSV